MSSIDKKRILFIAPLFFDYENDILKEMQEQGHDVTSVFYNYGSHRLPWKKIKKQKLINSQRILIQKYIRSIRYDLLFVIKGELIDTSIVHEFKNKNPSSITINYQWDPVNKFHGSIETIQAYDFKYTFDHLDCVKYKNLMLIHKPLFFTNDFRIVDCDPIYDIATIGGMMFSRVNIIKSIQKILPQFKYKILLRTSYTLSLPINIIKVGLITYFKISIHYDLNKKSVANILRQTNAVIDIPQPNQSGLSMRTIETLALGKKIITSNIHIDKYDFYNSNNILILSKYNYHDIPEFLKKPYIHIDQKIIKRYSIQNWVYSILCGNNETFLK